MRNLLVALIGASCTLAASAQSYTWSFAEAVAQAGSGQAHQFQDTGLQPGTSAATARADGLLAGAQSTVEVQFQSGFGRLAANLSVSLVTDGVWAAGRGNGGLDLGLSDLYGAGRIFGALAADEIAIGGIGAGGADFRIHYFLHGVVDSDSRTTLSWQAAAGVGAFGSGISLPGTPDFITVLEGAGNTSFLSVRSLDVHAARDTTLTVSTYLGAALSYRQDDPAVVGSFWAGLNLLNTAAYWIEPITPGLSFVSASGHDYLQAVPLPVPEPGTAALMLAGLALAAARARRAASGGRPSLPPVQ